MHMSQPISSAIAATAARLNEFIEVHRSRSDVTFVNHVRAKRKAIADRASLKKRIYLDTNAWKCMADYRQRKPSLTPAMTCFGKVLEQAAQSGEFVFPIGLPTFFELDSMTHPTTRATITDLVDELSQGLCIVPFQERIGNELRKLHSDDLNTPDSLEDFLCSPIELLGIPEISLPECLKTYADENTFNKAFFDSVSLLPFSLQLEVACFSPGITLRALPI